MKKILVIGSKVLLEEFQQLNFSNAELDFLDSDVYLGIEPELVTSALNGTEAVATAAGPAGGSAAPSGEPALAMNMVEGEPDFALYDILFDLGPEEFLDLEAYAELEGKLVVLGAAAHSLMTILWSADLEGRIQCRFAGMNALPTFINRSRLELSLYQAEDADFLAAQMEAVGMEYDLVEDRPGMVTPRVICMIINEACFMVQEGTADIPAVDQAMKLGTNYPKGPFEWADAIGVGNVVQVLEGIRDLSGDSKYKIAPLLMTKYLKGESFYS